jgi:hypothetical protein
VTFDGRKFDVSFGQCTYVLARDVADGNFTIALDYKLGQSLLVLSQGHSIQISKDGQVSEGARTHIGHVDLYRQVSEGARTHIGHV